jgi:hypothetical protein
MNTLKNPSDALKGLPYAAQCRWLRHSCHHVIPYLAQRLSESLIHVVEMSQECQTLPTYFLFAIDRRYILFERLYVVLRFAASLFADEPASGILRLQWGNEYRERKNCPFIGSSTKL